MKYVNFLTHNKVDDNNTNKQNNLFRVLIRSRVETQVGKTNLAASLETDLIKEVDKKARQRIMRALKEIEFQKDFLKLISMVSSFNKVKFKNKKK